MYTSGNSARYSCRCRTNPEHAQVDFGEAMAVIGGVKRKVRSFATDLPHSDGCLCKLIRRRARKPSTQGTTSASTQQGCSIVYDKTKRRWRAFWGMAGGSAI